MYSLEVGHIKQNNLVDLLTSLEKKFGNFKMDNNFKIPKMIFLSILRQDKKLVNKDYVKFVATKGIGKLFIENVKLSSLVSLGQKLGWVEK